MTNPNFSEHRESKSRAGGPKPPSPGSPKGVKGSLNERTANYPDVPGKTGPDRSAGVKKVKTHPQSKGL